MRVSREELAKALSCVSPGLSKHGIVEQSKCFVFTGGKVRTFNEEITCSMQSPLGSFEGAVESGSFLTILNKLIEEELDVDFAEGEIILKGKKRRVGLSCEQDILLPFDSVEEPEDWKPLNEEFPEAIGLTKDCTSADESKFALTCIHLTPNYIEATDNYHMLRYKTKTPIAEPVLVRSSSIRHLVDLGMTEIAETQSWIHFRNTSGLIFACRRWVDPYPEFPGFIKVAGTKVTLPGGLAEAIEKAEIFSSDNADSNIVTVSLKNDVMRIEGRGIHGWYQEAKKMQYSGDPITFAVLPKLFRKLSSYSHECLVDTNRLVVSAGRFVYATCLELR